MAAAAKYAPVVQAIHDGEHDADLDMILRVTQWRVKVAASKSGISKGAKVRFIDGPSSGDLAGKEAVVLKVNQKTVSVVIPCETCGRTTRMTEAEYEAAYDAVAKERREVSGGSVAVVPFTVSGICETCHGEPAEWRVSPSLIEAVTA